MQYIKIGITNPLTISQTPLFKEKSVTPRQIGSKISDTKRQNNVSVTPSTFSLTTNNSNMEKTQQDLSELLYNLHHVNKYTKSI